MEFAEWDMECRLLFPQVLEAIQGEIRAFLGADSGSANQPQGIGL
jgi:hypothetical protein